MGRKIVLTGTKLTDLSAPKIVNIDPMEAAGSLLLVDPTHPSMAWAGGVPANSTTVPNLFSENALALAGTGTGLTVRRGAWTSGGTLERTTRGGLHGALSPTLATPAGNEFLLAAPDALETYLLANQSHAFYLSTWHRLTRLAPAEPQTTMVQAITSNTTPGTNALAYSHHLGNVPGNQGRKAANILGTKLTNVSAQGWSGTAPANAAGMSITLFTALWSAFAFSDGKARAIGSQAFYRTYLEDLTVSGRTYAQADALDYELYTKEVLTSGGRYYGDTYTDPATIA